MFNLANYTPWVLFTDLGIILGLLLIGKIIRVKVKLVQKLFIPPSLLAGLLGLIFGPNGLGWLPLSNFISVYPAVLIAVVFGALPLSSPKFKMKEVAGRVGPMWAYSQLGMLIQWSVMGLFGLWVLKWIWPNLHDAFGVMLPTGFYGGHGTAAAIGAAFDGLGWDEAASLGMTTATVGIILAIVGGLFLSKWQLEKVTPLISLTLPIFLRSCAAASSKGEKENLPGELQLHRFRLIRSLSSGLVVLAAFGGYMIKPGVKCGIPNELPVFSCAFIVGLILKRFLMPQRSLNISTQNNRFHQQLPLNHVAFWSSFHKLEW